MSKLAKIVLVGTTIAATSAFAGDVNATSGAGLNITTDALLAGVNAVFGAVVGGLATLWGVRKVIKLVNKS